MTSLRRPIRIECDDLAAMLGRDRYTLVQGCSGESVLLAGAVRDAGERLGAMTTTGIFVPGLNRTGWMANPESRIETFFMTPQLRDFGPAVRFLPLCYSQILRRLRGTRIEAALFMVAPPDDDGICSFGPVVDFLAELWPAIPIRIAQINNRMPRTRGHPGIPFSELTAYVEQDASLSGMVDEAPDAVASAIGRHVAAFVPDGATLQTGLGRIPGAVLRALTGHRDLRIHSGLIGDATLDLAAAGALAEGGSIVAGVAIGSQRLYDAVGAEGFQFRPVSYTHSPAVLARIPRLVAINSAISVDLFGQAYSEVTPRGVMSGPGGAIDFARGVEAANGLRVICLPAVADRGAVSRIVPAGGGSGPVSLGRLDIDIVVTEHGAADLRSLAHSERAAALIAIAAPEHRPALRASWHETAKQL